MPSGRLGAGTSADRIRVLGGPVWTRRFHYGVSVRSLKPYLSKSKAKGLTNAASIARWRRKLRDAFKRYRVDRETQHPTVTELRKSVSEIVRLARRLTERLDVDRLLDVTDRLLNALESDRNAATAVALRPQKDGDVD